ncbi:hypothetical protein BDW22DRAFT_1423188 [Trametopsis cervina]|nr:hypothetical protein BDW22DRAFT_1423188 [Trametopsis cervina]
MPLTPVLHAAAKAMFRAINKEGIRAILIGGGAMQIIGAIRMTKDLDINVESVNEKRWKRILGDSFYVRPGSKSTRLRATYMRDDEDMSVRCDIASDNARNLLTMLKYSSTTEDGIRFATAPVLMASKFRSFSDRSVQTEHKRRSDLDDIFHCMELMRWDTLDPMVAEKMPDDLRDIFMTEHDIRRFFDTIDPMSRMMSYEYLQAGGIAIPSGRYTVGKRVKPSLIGVQSSK